MNQLTRNFNKSKSQVLASPKKKNKRNKPPQQLKTHTKPHLVDISQTIANNKHIRLIMGQVIIVVELLLLIIVVIITINSKTQEANLANNTTVHTHNNRIE